MKKFKGLLFIAFSLILLSGCAMKQEINMKINKDKSIDVGMTLAFDDELIDMMIADEEDNNYDDFNTKEYTDEERWAFLEKNLKNGSDGPFNELDKENVKIRKYDKDGFKGYVVSAKSNNIDEATVTDENELDFEEITDLGNSKLFVKNKGVYKAIIPLDIGDDYSNATIPSNMGLDMKLVVELPSKAINSNAPSVSEDGKTLTWDLTKVKENITFEFTFPSNILLNISLVVGIIIVFVIVIIAIITNKKDKNNLNNDTPTKLNKEVTNANESNNNFNQVNNQLNSINNQQNIIELQNENIVSLENENNNQEKQS